MRDSSLWGDCSAGGDHQKSGTLGCYNLLWCVVMHYESSEGCAECFGHDEMWRVA